LEPPVGSSHRLKIGTCCFLG